MSAARRKNESFPPTSVTKTTFQTAFSEDANIADTILILVRRQTDLTRPSRRARKEKMACARRDFSLISHISRARLNRETRRRATSLTKLISARSRPLAIVSLMNRARARAHELNIAAEIGLSSINFALTSHRVLSNSTSRRRNYHSSKSISPRSQ